MISIFTTLTNPEKRQDAWKEAIQSYTDFADEVVVVVGDESDHDLDFPNREKVRVIYSSWPKEFDWTFIGQQFQKGYDACTGDWVFRMDLDYIIHEDDFDDIKEFLKTCNAPSACMPKKQFLLVDRFKCKSLVPIVFNKKKYGNRIKLDAGGDLCQPSLDGVELKVDDLPIISRKVYTVIGDNVTQQQIKDRLPDLKEEDGQYYVMNKGIHIWNYDFCFKHKETIKHDFGRFARAWYKTFKTYTLGGPDDKSAFEYFKRMQIGRLKSGGWAECDIDQHPKYIKDKIINIKPSQFGYDVWGEI
jgi:glycosyltransferase involved in cell wall biosynthesis